MNTLIVRKCVDGSDSNCRSIADIDKVRAVAHMIKLNGAGASAKMLGINDHRISDGTLP
jgi:hypothetical protein